MFTMIALMDASHSTSTPVNVSYTSELCHCSKLFLTCLSSWHGVYVVSVALSLALSVYKDHKQLRSRSVPIVVGSAMILISKSLMGASVNAGQGSKRGGARKSARPKRFHPPPNPRVPAFKGYATLFTTAPRPSFFLFLPSSPLATSHSSVMTNST